MEVTTSSSSSWDALRKQVPSSFLSLSKFSIFYLRDLIKKFPNFVNFWMICVNSYGKLEIDLFPRGFLGFELYLIGLM